MSEVIGKEKITREAGYLYCVKKDGFVWACPMKSQVGKLKAKQVGSEKINKKPGYLYFVGKGGKVEMAPMKNVKRK